MSDIKETPNVLDVLGVSSHEDVITNAIKYCIDSSPAFSNAFLQGVCGVSVDKGIVRTCARPATSAGTPDLVLAVEQQGKKHLVIVENKLKADEGGDQTQRYASAACIAHLKEWFGWKDEQVAEIFIFLTLFPNQAPTSSAFRARTHRDLLLAAQHILPLSDELANTLLSSWITLLSDFYSREHFADNDILIDCLHHPNDPLEAGYMAFGTFVQGIPLSHGLAVEYIFRASERGRRYFGAVISKGSWHPKPMEKRYGTYRLVANQNFNIHFEPQFNPLKEVLSLYVHYEVNPYRTKRWVNAHVSTQEYHDYNNVRNGFIEALALRNLPKLKIGGRTNQIAKMVLKLDGLSVAEARGQISDHFRNLASPIDEILSSL